MTDTENVATINAEADTGKPQDPDADLNARVAALLATSSPTDRRAVSDFMGAVVPWPKTQADPGYVNLHWSFPDNKSTSTPKANVVKGGKPTRTVETFIGDVVWRLARPERYKDMFFCLSRQRDTKTSNNGKIRAAKSKAAALELKSIWVDIDVGPDEVDQAGKVVKAHYHTEDEALKAILLFAESVGLPMPSAIVRSGGGLHVYWINRDPLTPQEWFPYADGLKKLLLANSVLADSSITADAARILRVPGTFNHKPKYPQPMPVMLVDIPLVMYDFPAELAFLQQFAGPVVAAAPKPSFSLWAEDAPPGARERFNKGPAAAFAALRGEPGLSAGIDMFADHKLDPGPIFTNCGFYRDALLKGGKNHDNPLWNLAVLGTTFMEKGDEIAHLISKGHAGYSEDGTQALYNRKVAERSASRIGYPGCSAIQGAGCKACGTCPLLGKVKSPLNIRPDVTVTVNPAETPPQAEPPPNAAAGAHAHKQGPNPVARLMALRDQGADIGALLSVMNEAFAVTKHGGQIVIASLFGNEISFMTVDDFHKMFANLVIFKQAEATTEVIKVSRRWFEWTQRRQFLGRGVVFEPGGPLQIHGDMLNIWRGLGVEPQRGDWSLMRSHMLNVLCSGNQKHFDYLIRLMAWGVQHLDKPLGVAVAFLGPQGAGKGVVARTYGRFYGKHFSHITHGDQLTGRFNAGIGTACCSILGRSRLGPRQEGRRHAEGAYH